MSKLLVNEGTYIKHTIIKYTMIVSSQFERTNDRAFQIAGQYPITPGTLGPVSQPTQGIVMQHRALH